MRDETSSLPVTAGSPQCPRGHRLLGHLPALRREQMGFLERCARDYGDFVPLRLGPARAFLLSHPDLVEEVFVEKSCSFNRGPGIYRNRNLFGGGLLASQGGAWRRQRKLIQPAFQRERLAEYAAGMSACADEMMRDWRDGETRDIHREMMRLALRNIIGAVFGTDSERVWSASGEEIAAAMDTLPEVLLRRMNGPLLFTPESFPAPTNMRLKRIISRLDAVLYPLIKARRAQPVGEHSDLLAMLLEARDEADGPGMSDREIRDELVTFLFAGHETTAAVMTWMWYLLARHPEQRAGIEAELQRVLDGRAPSAEDAGALVCIEQAVRETMRLYPPGWVLGREAQEDCVIGGHPIRKGSILLMSAWVIQRDPRFFDEPERYLPERWADGLMKRIPRFAYFPFGGGPRICIGSAFALMEIVMVTAAVAKRYRLDLPDGSKTVEAPIQPAVTLRPKGGLVMRISRRQDA